MDETLANGFGGERSPRFYSVFSVIASFVLLSMGFTSLIYTLPLLDFVARSRREERMKVFLPSFLLVVGRSIYYSWGLENFLLWLVLDLYVPLSLLAAGFIWSIQRKGGIGTRLFWSMVPSALAALILGVVFFMYRALFDAFYLSMKDAFVSIMGGMLDSLGIVGDVDFLFTLMSIVVGVFTFPVILGASCVSIFYYENRRHSKETHWDDVVAALEFNTNTIWLLILFLFLFLLGRFMPMPLALSILFMSLVVSMILVYAIQGFAVLMAWIRNRGLGLRSPQLLFILFIVSFLIPGLNIIVLIGVPLLGILENFFDLKTRRKK